MKTIIVIAAISLIFLSGCSSPENDGIYDEFAQCTNDNGMVVYSSMTCSHCAQLKANFGSSFQYVNDIECHPQGPNSQTDLCLEKKIQVTPTFEFADGSVLEGIQSFETLAEKTGCALPEVD